LRIGVEIRTAAEFLAALGGFAAFASARALCRIALADDALSRLQLTNVLPRREA
jgi:hypothetical protein